MRVEVGRSERGRDEERRKEERENMGNARESVNKSFNDSNVHHAVGS